ncbi:MAG: CvpA family protein [Candidatus Omnitrophota bacterium]
MTKGVAYDILGILFPRISALKEILVSLTALSRVNWVDILLIIIIIRITYTGSFLGVGAQVIPFLATLFTVGVSYYFYGGIADFLSDKLSFPASTGKFLAFFLLVFLFGIVMKLVMIVVPVRKPETLILIEQSFGLILGFLRGIMIAGIVVTILVLLPVSGVDGMVEGSALGMPVLRMNAELYAKTINILDKRKEAQMLQADGIVSQITAEKDYVYEPFGGDLKKKSRFFKNEF